MGRLQDWLICPRIAQGWVRAQDCSVPEASFLSLLSLTLNSQFLGKLENICRENPWFGFSQACQRKLDLSGNKICWPWSQRLTFSFMFYMTHFKLQCSTDIERSLPLPTLPQTSHNGKVKNFLHKQGFFFFKQKASLWWDFFPARIPTGRLSQFLQKATMKEEGSFWDLCLCVMWNIAWISLLGIRRIRFEPLW